MYAGKITRTKRVSYRPVSHCVSLNSRQQPICSFKYNFMLGSCNKATDSQKNPNQKSSLFKVKKIMLFALKGFTSCTVAASSVLRPSNQIRKNLKSTFREKEETWRRVPDEGSPLWDRQACRRCHIYVWISISNIGYPLLLLFWCGQII